jgi:serine/threonine-protein kinase
MHRAPDAFLHQVVGGRWRLLEVLGATEHGAAFRAEAVEDGRLARLELWDQRHVERRGELARFEREARTLSRLRHERCLSVVAFGAHEGRPFLVSELPEGSALRDELGKGELTVSRALSLALQLFEGLRHLHGHGVVHRALLPENVWVARTQTGDVLKIGLPRIAQTSDVAARPDRRADLYAAGLLLYGMCTGREPPPEVVAAMAGRAPVPPPRVVSPERAISEGVERVLLRALAPSPDARFGTADELLAALQAAGVQPTPPKRRPVQRSGRRAAIVATTFAAVSVLGVGAWRSSGGQGPSAPPAAQAAQAPQEAQPPSLPAKAAVVAPALPRAAIATPPPVGPSQVPVPVRAAPIAATSSGATPRGERDEIWSLLDSGRLDEGASRIKALVAKDEDAAWPRFALGVLYYRKYWRHDAVRQWQLALAQDPEIRRDPQFGAYLCFMLDDTWKAAGATELLNQLGAKAVPLIDHCVASAKNRRLRFLASRALERLRR